MPEWTTDEYEWATTEDLSWSVAFLQTLTGSLTPVGTLLKKIGKIFTGSLTPTGALSGTKKRPFRIPH
tara:strand:- start:8868 stop:9071 length:204 start_codon:yes stop_codon:yes gene_type:complete